MIRCSFFSKLAWCFFIQFLSMTDDKEIEKNKNSSNPNNETFFLCLTKTGRFFMETMSRRIRGRTIYDDN